LARLLAPYMRGERPEFPTLPVGAPGAPPGQGIFDLPGQGLLPPLPTGDDRFPTGRFVLGASRIIAGTGSGRTIDYRHLDSYYQQRAAELPVQAPDAESSPSRRPESLTVGFHGAEPAPLSALVSGKVDWVRSLRRWAADGGMYGVITRSDPLTIPADGEEPQGPAAPHLLLMVDSSGSMAFRPQIQHPAGRGPFDVVLTACYGIFKHIEMHNLGTSVKVCCLNFSSHTIASHWHAFADLGPVKNALLTHQGGGTRLDTEAVRWAFISRPGRFLAIVITDGVLSNVVQAADEMRNIVADGCSLVLLHVGKPNAFTDAVKALGCPVHLITNVNDLVGLTLSVAEQQYAHQVQ